MSEKQGAELNGSSLYLDYMGAKSSFKKQQRGGQGGRGNDRRGGRGGFGGDRQSNSGKICGASFFTTLTKYVRNAVYLLRNMCSLDTPVSLLH